MPLGTEIGLVPGDIVFDGDPAPPTVKGTVAPTFSVHDYCGQTVAHLSNCSALVEICQRTNRHTDVLIAVPFTLPRAK